MRSMRPLLIASIVLFALSSCNKKDTAKPPLAVTVTNRPVPDSTASVRTSTKVTYPYTDTFCGQLYEALGGMTQLDTMITFYVFHTAKDTIRIIRVTPIVMSYDGFPRDTVEALNYTGSFHVNPAGYYTWFPFVSVIDTVSNGLRIHLKYDTLIYDSKQNAGLGCGNNVEAYVVATRVR